MIPYYNIMITEQMLKEICDRVENSLENYVLEHKGQLFEDGKIIEGGMEGQIKNLYETRVSSLIISKGENIKSLTQIQQKYIEDRMKNTLELSKKQYES
ncbi:hypothetical protein BG20_I0479 [Candidatus Nitrosarchaeum limnium BG20]|jgi:hypothetical protein|uniref:Uncharacterized protein n=2 Tax=Nitrosarchaeum TaxID=1007082 RepID=S2EW44_9ARCH|nr:hypothetical protein BG20_I0479 [Candidatus Nitrosarchaeum limnium BG20]